MPDPVGHDELDTGLQRQEAEMRLRLVTAGFGASGVRLAAGPVASTRIPFQLGPLKGTALMRGAPEVAVGGALGSFYTTTWDLVLVPDPDAPDWTPADLLEALGVEVTRW